VTSCRTKTVECRKLDHSIVVATISQWRRSLCACVRGLTVDIFEHIYWCFLGSLC